MDMYNIIRINMRGKAMPCNLNKRIRFTKQQIINAWNKAFFSIGTNFAPHIIYKF
jgi:hypothetical protein